MFRRNLKNIVVVRLKQNALCMSETVSHSTVRSLPEIPAFSMFKMGTSRNKSYLHICYRRSGKNTCMCLFIQMSHNQSLPVFIKNLFSTVCFKHKSASLFTRFKQQMYFSIMPEWLIMADTLNRSSNSFLVRNISMDKFNIHMESLQHKCFDNIKLHLTHDLNVYFLKLFIPDNMKFRFLCFQSPERSNRLMYICFRRQFRFICKYRFKKRRRRIGFISQALSCI